MESEWTTTTVGSLCKNVTSGGTPRSSNKSYYSNEGIPWLNTKEVNFERIHRTEKFISQEGFENSAAKWIPANSVIIAMYGATAGKVATNAIPLTTNQACCNLIIDHEKADHRFVYYHLSANTNTLLELANGAAQQNLNSGTIKNFPIPFPSLPEQKAIAHILGTLDDKIELNRKMNATLEGMAQALFKSWFVDFDPVIDNALAAGNPIPDELAPRAKVRRQALANGTANREAAKPFPAAFQETEALGWIPEGWEVRAIGNSFQLLGGHSFKSGDYVEDGRFGIVTIKNVQDGSFVQECTNRITEIPGKMKSHCHLNSGDVLLSLTGNVGRVCVVSEGDFLLNQRVSKIVGRDGIPEAFGYFFFRQETLYERMITIAKGTAQQNLSPIETAKLEQAMPCNQTIVELGEHLREFHVKMVGNTSQSQTLTKLRDTLLPKLISGELRIPEAKQLIEKTLDV